MATTKTTKTPKAKPAAKAAVAAPAAEAKKTLHRRTMVGIVLSDKMMKTRVVSVERHVKNTAYGKITTKRNKFKIHDENNQSKTGDLVSIIESRLFRRRPHAALST